MVNVSKVIDETLFEISVNDSKEDYKEKMKNIILQMNSLLENTGFEIVSGEMISEKENDLVFLTLKSRFIKE